MRGDRLLAPVAIRGAVLGGVVLLAAVPVYVFVEAPWRTLVARLAVAFVLGVALLQLRARGGGAARARGGLPAGAGARAAGDPRPGGPLAARGADGTTCGPRAAVGATSSGSCGRG